MLKAICSLIGLLLLTTLLFSSKVESRAIHQVRQHCSVEDRWGHCILFEASSKPTSVATSSSTSRQWRSRRRRASGRWSTWICSRETKKWFSSLFVWATLYSSQQTSSSLKAQIKISISIDPITLAAQVLILFFFCSILYCVNQMEEMGFSFCLQKTSSNENENCERKRKKEIIWDLFEIKGRRKQEH